MYKKIIDLIKIEGDKLSSVAGKIEKTDNVTEWTTTHDLAIEQKFKELIATFSENHILYSEELHTTFTSAKDVWILDPISHTVNFIHGVPHYAIAISHLYEGEVLFACIYDPSMKELFTAEKGKGAFLNGEEIHVKNSHSKPLILFRPYALGNWSFEETLEIYRKISSLGYIDSLGSMGLQFAYVAAGRVELVVMANKDTFPLFAGKLLVEEAGGKFSDFRGNELTIDSRGVIAGTPEFYEKVFKLLNATPQQQLEE